MTKVQPVSAPSAASTICGVPRSAQALAIGQIVTGALPLGRTPRLVVHVTATDREMDEVAGALPFFAPEAEVLRLPAWDCMPYDRVSPHASIMAERMETLAALAAPGRAPRALLTTVNALLQKLPPHAAIAKASYRLAAGKPLAREALVEFLLVNGYRRAGTAMETGEFALRGGIVDIVPPGYDMGVRIDCFGDEIESIRAFDPLSQLSAGASLQSLTLRPASEVLLEPENIQRFRQAYRDCFGAVAKENPLYESVSQGVAYPGMEHWLPLFYAHAETLFDYTPGALFTLDHEASAAIVERQDAIADYFETRKATLAASAGAGQIYHPLPPEHSFIMPQEWRLLEEREQPLSFSPFQDENGAPALNYKPIMRPGAAGSEARANPFERLRALIAAMRAHGKATLLACYSEGSCDRLQTLLCERAFHAVRIQSWKDAGDIGGKSVGLCVLPLESGFETERFALLSEQDVLGERIMRSRPKKRKSELFLQEAANFQEGELVVHKEHGIGRFDGLVTLDVSGARHDCLKLLYEGDDKLFLPVENIEMVSRYGSEEDGAKLDKLGGAGWQARKARLKERIKIAAEALLATAAARITKPGQVLHADLSSYEEFCARFPYMETDDQATAIADVVADFESGKPMDRLICGDVGFGKTEVALRAAFIAAAGHQFQVAVITPTTLLARQHYKNFQQRFSDFDVTVRQMSRMVPTREQRDTREKLAAGEVGIVIGTHALLSKTVKFKRLGLVIVDEEQHFGVVQKEKLKALKADVHVLTLSATPIPRTLQMALAGVRDLSLITTPPVDRLAVRSFVTPFDPVVLREAILREVHRAGRVFVVTPRIKDIAELKEKLLEITPDVRIGVAHGQMAASDLDGIMNDFYDGKFDMLLSTSIIESGLDIPQANTIIIDRADRFGLAQLYQMRGRVGRGKTRAYAYFLLPHYRQLSKNATRRLEVMQTLDSLGAGFQLASHDMDIRGFGNLVGEEQSGHIREVGIELYQQMLQEAVEALRTKAAHHASEELSPASTDGFADDWSPQINLAISVLIPESYVSDLQLRLGLYRRLAQMEQSEDIDSMAAEMVDRFGPLPGEVRHLFDIMGLKRFCKQAGIDRIDAGPKGAVISFRHNNFSNPEALLNYVAKNLASLKIRPDQKLVVMREWKDDVEKLSTLSDYAKAIAALYSA